MDKPRLLIGQLMSNIMPLNRTSMSRCVQARAQAKMGRTADQLLGLVVFAETITLAHAHSNSRPLASTLHRS